MMEKQRILEFLGVFERFRKIGHPSQAFSDSKKVKLEPKISKSKCSIETTVTTLFHPR